MNPEQIRTQPNAQQEGDAQTLRVIRLRKDELMLLIQNSNITGKDATPLKNELSDLLKQEEFLGKSLSSKYDIWTGYENGNSNKQVDPTITNFLKKKK